MSIFAAFGKLFQSKHGAKQPRTQRSHRYAAHGFSTPFGEVKDLSASGMQLISPRKISLEVGQRSSMRLSSAFQQVVVTAQLVWTKKVGDQFAAGFKFVDLAAEVREAVECLAKHGFAQTTAGPGPRRGAHAGPGSAGTKRTIFEQRLLCEDLYEYFGVQPNATEDELRHAYRVMAQRLHPDCNTAPDADAQFAKLTKSYSVLKDPEKRKRYDEMRSRNQNAAVTEGPGETPKHAA